MGRRGRRRGDRPEGLGSRDDQAPPHLTPAEARSVARRIEDVVRQLGCEALELDVRAARLVRLVLDRDDAPVTTDLLVECIRAIRRDLTADGFDPGDFQIEVDSPGSRRILKTARHFDRFKGRVVQVTDRDGSVRRATLLGADGDRALLREQSGDRTSIDPDRVRSIRLAP